MNKVFFIKQLDDILIEFNQIQSKSEYDNLGDISIQEITSILTKSKAAIVRIVGEKSAYYNDVDYAMNRSSSESLKLFRIIGIVQALKSDLEHV